MLPKSRPLKIFKTEELLQRLIRIIFLFHYVDFPELLAQIYNFV